MKRGNVTLNGVKVVNATNKETKSKDSYEIVGNAIPDFAKEIDISAVKESEVDLMALEFEALELELKLLKPALYIETQKTIRLSEQDQKIFAALYGSFYAGATHALESYLHIRRVTLREIREVFSRSEWLVMIDTLKGIMKNPQFMANPSALPAVMEHAKLYNKVSIKLGVENYHEFLNKLNKLTSAQAFFTLDEIFRFWEDDKRDIEQFIDQHI